jgi:hypothetical protein
MARRPFLVLALALLAVPALPHPARAQAYLPEDNLAYPVQVLVDLTRYADVDISSQIFMFGYPSVGVAGFTQIDTTRPLVRGGIVAGLNAALKTIIIDSPVNHGNSGGPVVQLSRTNRLRIIGIATQFVPVPEDVVGVKPGESILALGNSGYGVVASADAIIELISQF